ncbi:MAG: hypothetical protein VX916_03920 [Planctomycetota bacterium]|nr:hypothetical protein [Planctomycetota bacterium]
MMLLARSFVFAVTLVSSVVLAQDSVSLNTCGGDAVNPWADATTAGGSEQINSYIVDLAPLSTSWGNEFGIAPLVKPSRTSTGFFTSGISAQAISKDQAVGVPFASTNYDYWHGPGFGVHNDPAVNLPGSSVGPSSLPSHQFGVGFSEWGTTDLGGSWNGVTTAVVNYVPAVPSRLYVTRINAANNSCDGSGDVSQFGFGGVDADGTTVIRADSFGAIGACGLPLVFGDNIFKVDSLARNGAVQNIASGLSTTFDATELVLVGSGTTHSTPTLLPSSVAGGAPRYLGTNFNSQFTRQNTAGAYVAGGGHLDSSVSDHRGNIAYTPRNSGAVSSTHGICAQIGQNNNGEATILNLWGLNSNSDVSGTKGLALPPFVVDNETGFIVNPGEFDHYHSQVSYRGGNGQVAVGTDQAGNLIAAATADHPQDGGADWPINYVAVCRVDAATGASEWTIAGYNDGTLGPSGTGKAILDADGNTIGRMVTLDLVTGGAPFGPSISSPMIDSVGNIWFLSAIELFDNLGGFSDFDVALLRAVYDPATFSYRLELVLEPGNVFHGPNSNTDYQIRFMQIADSNSVSSGSAWSGNISSVGHNSANTANLSTEDPRTLGGLVLSIGITYDMNADGDFTTCFNGGVDQDYTVLMYIGNRFWPSVGGGLPGTTTPELFGEGSLVQGETIRLTLKDALPQTFTTLVVGLANINAPFKGGTLVPSPDMMIAIPTASNGSWSLPSPWPLPPFPGLELYLQAWYGDAGGPNGFSASNGVLIRTP